MMKLERIVAEIEKTKETISKQQSRQIGRASCRERV